MIRGKDFYAIWCEKDNCWSRDEQVALKLIDEELKEYANQYRKDHPTEAVRVLYMWDSENGMMDRWLKYIQKHLRDNYVTLDEKLIFSNDEIKKDDYASKKLPYPLTECNTDAWDQLVSTLYSKEEREKLEWAIGAVVSGDSKHIQKFVVLYGSAGTGKSTVLNIIQMLFEGYYSVFDAKALGSSTNVFALEAFRSNPLVAIQHDGDLSRIEDNTRLNSLVSHELMTVNEKFKSTYQSSFKSFLFMGTNKPVKITDSKSGLIRRLIDISPSGNKIPFNEYNKLMEQIKFELGGIANKCLSFYKSHKHKYDSYIPTDMIGATNDFYNFVLDNYYNFEKEDRTTLKRAWALYKEFCSDANVPYPFSQRVFKEELKNYFWEFTDKQVIIDGARCRNVYTGFRTDRFTEEKAVEEVIDNKFIFDKTSSLLDDELKDFPAQYANAAGTPKKVWKQVTTTLKDIDTTKLHFVKVPENHIVIDFDIKDSNGNKSLEANLEAASKFPLTYGELSKSGAGIHLHYIYDGDVSLLDNSYDDDIEVKVYKGDASLRRQLTKCNDIPIAHINSGLPIKEKRRDSMISKNSIRTEEKLRSMIDRNMNKEFHPGTKPSMDFIKKILDDAYESGVKYDVSDMRNRIRDFAAGSSNQAGYCLKLLKDLKWKSEDCTNIKSEAPLVIYDIEIFPNKFFINYKLYGKDKPMIRLINPTSEQVEELLKYRLIGFNCRRYDNHLIYAAMMGYSVKQLYLLSKSIIDKKTGFFGEAYNLSYTDVYDYCAKKQSLKKWEIELGIHHQELGLPWDEPVDEKDVKKVSEYCDNDVYATEAVFDATQADFLAREILADIAGGTVNDTTNSLSTKLIFGNNRHPQDEFNYRNMGEIKDDENYYILPDDYKEFGDRENAPDNLDGIYNVFDMEGRPIFPGYKFENGKSHYRGEEISEGGNVYAEPGTYYDVALLDIASMHPTSVIQENLFGDRYTKIFEDLVNTRLAIKHGNLDFVREVFDGKLAKYITDDPKTLKNLSQALKIVINSVYGLTSAKFENPFRDVRNVDNIVAKRGALFMCNLKHEVQKRGFTVAHIKTDSIKIPNATPEIIKFVMDYGKEYGYTFEHEATYSKMCLVNDAVYIAEYADGKDHDFKLSTGEVVHTPWTATGAQFQVPYVFKKLFSGDEIKFDDLCVTKSVSTALYLDKNEKLPNVEDVEIELNKRHKGAKRLNPAYADKSDEELVNLISKGHNYRFIGKVGQFCPMKDGVDAGYLYREKDGSYYSVGGTKNYKFLESEYVKNLNLEDSIDVGYFENMANEAAETLATYGFYSESIAAA